MVLVARAEKSRRRSRERNGAVFLATSPLAVAASPPKLQPHSQGLSSSRPRERERDVKRRDPGNEVDVKRRDPGNEVAKTFYAARTKPPAT